ncbi:MAG TPA: tyrosine-type recombinase/integrase [Mycobacterium sp.]|nr:tyrosine-type recombinase/integrase [Mycobacterium sp.]
MTSLAAATAPAAVDLLADYAADVAGLSITPGARSDRIHRARLFLGAHPDLAVWMTRSTATRLLELHRVKAWPFLTWLFVTGRVRPDLELILAKPCGVDLPAVWAAANPRDVKRVEVKALEMGWSPNWTRQVVVLAMSLVCVWAAKTLDELNDADFDAVLRELDVTAGVTPSARTRLRTRVFSLRHVCFQLGVCATPARMAQPPALSAAGHAGSIPQPDIRREVVRYAETITTVLRPATVQMRIKSIRVLCEWLAVEHPDLRRLDQLDRVTHIEPFLIWARTRPWRGKRGKGRIVSATQFHHDIIDLRVFFEDIAEWGWPSQPKRRLFFLADLPRLPEALPRALSPAFDRDVMDAVDGLEDAFARTALIVLRATGMRIGELLDIELDCLVDFGAHGTWLKVPLGKLGTERMVPLDPEPLAALDTWIAARGEQRTLAHPRDGRPADFVFIERGRRPGAHRVRQGLHRAVADAGLVGPGGTPLRVTPHQLRHTFGTTLVNAGMNLPALMALMGHVTPEMTLRYAKVASPTIRASYEQAMTKVRSRRPLFVIPVGQATAVPAKVDWLRSEMLKTRLAHGFCSRDLVAGACPYANICEQCDNFVPDADRATIIDEQLADVRQLETDAQERGWTGEAARHHRVSETLERHAETARRRPSP